MDRPNKKMRRLLSKASSKIPAMNEYLDEKRELSIHVKKQKQTIEALKQQNRQLRVRIEKEISKRKEKKTLLPSKLRDEIAAASNTKYMSKKFKKKPPFNIDWVMPPILGSSGGQKDIIRSISYLISKGHRCRIFVFDPDERTKKEDIRSVHLKTGIKISMLKTSDDVGNGADIVFATHWTTAYPVLNAKTAAKKYYYVQDFEPLFHPPGSYQAFAEHTYKFGFKALTLGEWLSKKLNKNYDMKSDSFNFGFDPRIYFPKNRKHNRNGVVFYARPRTPRRGFELGLMALEMFHKKHPEQTIHFFGEDISGYKIPFPYKNHGILSQDQLNDLYNQTFTGLILSFSNMSLIPLEMLAAGCIPVVNSEEYTRSVPYSEHVLYCEPTPHHLCRKLEEGIVISDKNRIAKTEAIKDLTWDNSNESIEKIITKDFS